MLSFYCSSVLLKMVLVIFRSVIPFLFPYNVAKLAVVCVLRKEKSFPLLWFLNVVSVIISVVDVQKKVYFKRTLPMISAENQMHFVPCEPQGISPDINRLSSFSNKSIILKYNVHISCNNCRCG